MEFLPFDHSLGPQTKYQKMLALAIITTSEETILITTLLSSPITWIWLKTTLLMIMMDLISNINNINTMINKFRRCKKKMRAIKKFSKCILKKMNLLLSWTCILSIWTCQTNTLHELQISIQREARNMGREICTSIIYTTKALSIKTRSFCRFNQITLITNLCMSLINLSQLLILKNPLKLSMKCLLTTCCQAKRKLFTTKRIWIVWFRNSDLKIRLFLLEFKI